MIPGAGQCILALLLFSGIHCSTLDSWHSLLSVLDLRKAGATLPSLRPRKDEIWSSGGRAAPQPTFASEAEVTRPVGGDPPCSEARPISRTRQVPGQRFRTSPLPRRGSGLNCAGCLCLPGVTRLITPAGRGLFQAPAWQHAETPACGFRSASGLGPPAALFLSGDTSDTPASSV